MWSLLQQSPCIAGCPATQKARAHRRSANPPARPAHPCARYRRCSVAFPGLTRVPAAAPARKTAGLAALSRIAIPPDQALPPLVPDQAPALQARRGVPPLVAARLLQLPEARPAWAQQEGRRP